MQSLEELIYQRMIGSEALMSRLTEYSGVPAVFHQRAPDDTAQGWKNGRQCPRLGYAVDWRTNAERKTSGILAVNIFCDKQGTRPEDVEPLVREVLCGVFLTPEGSFPYSLAWASSEPIQWERTGEGHTDTLFEGNAMLFDVYAFPRQAATDPDPVLAMNEFMRNCFPEVVVIGESAVPRVLEPTAERPVFYFREETSETDRETNMGVWVNAVLACHVFAGGQEGAWIRTLSNFLRLAGEAAMLDNSPMFMKDVRTNNTAAALSTGQIRIHAQYGLIRQAEPVPALLQAIRSLVPQEKGC